MRSRFSGHSFDQYWNSALSQPIGIAIDHDQLGGRIELSRQQCRHAHRPGTDDHHAVTRLDLARQHADFKAGGQDIAEHHQGLLIGPGRQAFTQVLQDSTASYVAAPKTWTAQSPQVINVAKQSGAQPEEVPPVLALYQFPLASEQAGPAWLGGGAAKALAATAEFLKAQKKIPALLPDYSAAISSGHWDTQNLEA